MTSTIFKLWLAVVSLLTDAKAVSYLLHLHVSAQMNSTVFKHLSLRRGVRIWPKRAT